VANDIFSINARHADWLALRRLATAENIANVNTPHYQAKDVRPFEVLVDARGAAPSVTHAAHQSPSSHASLYAAPASGDGVSSTGRSVDLEQELLKSGEIARAHALNAAVVKSFHRLLLATTKLSA
jgi:flagellar basal-body rod protein FlgB